MVRHRPHHRRDGVAGLGRELTAYAARDWRANFFPVGIAHSIVGGTAWEPTPWRAVQRAAWEALMHAKDEASAYEGGPTRRWLKVKQKGWTAEGDGWQRRINALAPPR